MRLKLIAPRREVRDLWDMSTTTKLLGKGYPLALLALPTLAALTPADVEVIVTDENVEPVDFGEKVDLVGISFNTSQACRAYEIADTFRERGMKVILGGIHASMLPQEASQHADAVVIGEADNIWVGLIDDFRGGRLQKRYVCSQKPDLEDSPPPRWDLLKSSLYVEHSLQTTRGCPFNCEFCTVSAFFGRRYRCKPVENVLKEIEALRQIDSRRLIFFVDDNIIADPEYAKTLLRALIPLKINRWWGQVSVNLAKDEELLDLMAESGCSRVLIGFESLSQENLKLMGKGGVNRVEDYARVIEEINSKGIQVVGAFMLGCDCDDESVFENTVRFIMDTNIAFPQITILTPFPGTRLYQRLEQEGRILHKDWSKYTTSSVCFKPALMSPEALQNGYEWVLQQVYSYPALYKNFCSLCSQNVIMRHKYSLSSPFTMLKILVTLKSFFSRDIKQVNFVLKSLWHPKGTFLFPVLWALSLHDFAYSFPTAVDPRVFSDVDKL